MSVCVYVYRNVNHIDTNRSCCKQTCNLACTDLFNVPSLHTKTYISMTYITGQNLPPKVGVNTHFQAS